MNYKNEAFLKYNATYLMAKVGEYCSIGLVASLIVGWKI